MSEDDKLVMRKAWRDFIGVESLPRDPLAREKIMEAFLSGFEAGLKREESK